jgi:hypothetical protein
MPPRRSGRQGGFRIYLVFRHEDHGTAPQFALRLLQVMGAQPAPV